MLNFVPPNSEDIKSIARNYLEDRYSVERLTTGLCHYVFDVKGANERFVVRVCHPDNEGRLRGNIYWSNELKDKNLPIPKILKSSIGEEKFSYLILEYLDGIDFGKIVDDLSDQEIEGVVDSLILYDDIAKQLPIGSGFGWGLNYSCSQLVNSWPDVVENSLERAKQWITEVGKVDLSILEKVKSLHNSFAPYLKSVQSSAYFHDLTTKNLLISPNGHQIVGFVDIDEMGFGDSIFHLSLMKMALFSGGHSEDLVELWLDKTNASAEQRDVLIFYTLVHCVAFMGENGKAFNKEEAFFNEKYHHRLNKYYNNLVSRLV